MIRRNTAIEGEHEQFAIQLSEVRKLLAQIIEVQCARTPSDENTELANTTISDVKLKAKCCPVCAGYNITEGPSPNIVYTNATRKVTQLYKCNKMHCGAVFYV
jgi:hypothetical protein